MDLKELKGKLKKEKDPEKFLEKLLKETKDKKLKELIKKLLEKKQSFGESGLERTVRRSNVKIETKEPELKTVEVVEERGVTRASARPDLVVGAKRSEDYGIKAGSKNYETGGVIKQLEESSLVAKEGHLGTAETQSLIDKKTGEYDINKEERYSQDKRYERPMRESFVQESQFEESLTHGERMAKKKKRLGDYVK